MGAGDKLFSGDLWRRNCATVINDLEADVAADIAAVISDTAYDSGWNGVTGVAPSKNAVYDQIQTMLGIIPDFGTGSYTPTLTNIGNLDSSGSGAGIYINLNGTAFVAGSCDVNPTATGLTTLGISLPIASNLGAVTDLFGVAASPVATQCGGIYGDTTNNRAELLFNASDTANRSIFFVFGYRIIPF